MRIVSGLALIAGVAVLVWLGGPVYAIGIIVIALLALREWVRMIAPTLRGWPVVGAAAALTVGLAVDAVWGPGYGIPVLIVAGVSAWLLLRRGGRFPAGRVALGLPYIGTAGVAFLWLRELPDIGLIVTAWLFLVVAAVDIGGLVVGRTVGGPKLAPRISPKKTWSGLIGAVVAAMIVGGAVAGLLDRGNIVWMVVLAGSLGIVAQLGDLLESAVKRHYGLKDSGGIIPGHGGILDRIDGLLAAAPALAVALMMTERGGTIW